MKVRKCWIGGIKRNQFDSKTVGERGHKAEKATGRIDLDHRTHGLNHFPGGKIDQRFFHCRNQLLHPQMPLHRFFIEIKRLHHRVLIAESRVRHKISFTEAHI